MVFFSCLVFALQTRNSALLFFFRSGSQGLVAHIIHSGSVQPCLHVEVERRGKADTAVCFALDEIAELVRQTLSRLFRHRNASQLRGGSDLPSRRPTACSDADFGRRTLQLPSRHRLCFSQTQHSVFTLACAVSCGSRLAHSFYSSTKEKVILLCCKVCLVIFVYNFVCTVDRWAQLSFDYCKSNYPVANCTQITILLLLLSVSFWQRELVGGGNRFLFWHSSPFFQQIICNSPCKDRLCLGCSPFCDYRTNS